MGLCESYIKITNKNNGEVPYYIKRTLISNMLQWVYTNYPEWLIQYGDEKNEYYATKRFRPSYDKLDERR